jgi:hypothetical protein
VSLPMQAIRDPSRRSFVHRYELDTLMSHVL